LAAGHPGCSYSDSAGTSRDVQGGHDEVRLVPNSETGKVECPSDLRIAAAVVDAEMSSPFRLGDRVQEEKEEGDKVLAVVESGGIERASLRVDSHYPLEIIPPAIVGPKAKGPIRGWTRAH